MAQDPNLQCNHASDNSITPTPSGSTTNYFKHKYSRFVKKVKYSTQKAKHEAKRKRLRQKTLRRYKNNNRIIEAHQNRRNYILSTETLQNNPQTTENNSDERMMDGEWTCIVIQKQKHKKKQIPPNAPPPVPHHLREQYERKNSNSNSNPVQTLLNQIVKKKQTNKSQITNANEDNNALQLNMDTAMVEGNICDDNDKNNNICNNNHSIIIEWEWCDDGGRWHKYGASTCKEIESFYSNAIDKYEYDIFGRMYCIDFKQMKQFNNLNQAWNVRRCEISQHKCE